MPYCNTYQTIDSDISKESVYLPAEMYPAFFDERLSAHVVEGLSPKRLGRNGNDVLLPGVCRFELRFDRLLPFSPHDVFDTCPTELVPPTTQPVFDYALEDFINENATTEPA